MGEYEDYAEAIGEIDSVSYDDDSRGSEWDGRPIPMLSSEDFPQAEEVVPRVRRNFVETWLWELLNSTE